MANQQLSSLVERLAEAESQLVDRGGSDSGNNSAAASEERDSMVLGAAVLDDLEQSSNVDSRCSGRSNEMTSDVSSSSNKKRNALQPSAKPGLDSLHAAGAAQGSGEKRSCAGDESSKSGSSLSERLATFMIDASNTSSPNSSQHDLTMDMWKELMEQQDARQHADTRLRNTEEALESAQAEHVKEIKSLQEELNEQQEALALDLNAKKNLQRNAVQLIEENALLRKQLKATKQREEDAENERDVLRRNLKTLQSSHSMQVNSLKEQLGNNSKLEPDGSLRQELEKTQHAHQELAEELSEMRLHMLDVKKSPKQQVGDLQMMLDAASIQMEESEKAMAGAAQPEGASPGAAPHLLNKPTGRKRGVLGKKMSASVAKLGAIEEDLDSVNESCNPTFNVSSDAGGGGGVGDMDDFDDMDVVNHGSMEATQATLKALQDMLQLEKAVVQKKKDEPLKEKTGQLAELMQTSRKQQAELAAVKHPGQGDDARHAPQLDSLAKLLEVAQARSSASPEEAQAGQPRGSTTLSSSSSQSTRESETINELTQQNNALREAKRFAEARVEDLKHALTSQEKKHKKEMDELLQKLQRAGRSEGDADEEISDLKNRLRSAEEDKNLLSNTSEWKEVQWKSRIESLERELEEAKRKHENEVKKLESDLAALEVTAKRAQEAGAQAPPAAAPSSSSSVFGLLRCPMRLSAGSQGALPAYCQDICWRVLSTVSDTVALWCGISDYSIIDASREANRIWGSASLQGKSVLSLANGPSTAAWLKKAFTNHQRLAEMERGDRGPPGFIVRDLGCETFTSKDGTTFDSSVITAHFPPEASVNKQAAILVIMEPQKRVSSNHAAGHGRSQRDSPGSGSRDSMPRIRGSAQRSRSQRSSHSEVSASSVSPSDSASNVFNRQPGMW